MKNIFPYVLAVLQLGAGVMSATQGDWKKALYWLGAVVIAVSMF